LDWLEPTHDRSGRGSGRLRRPPTQPARGAKRNGWKDMKWIVSLGLFLVIAAVALLAFHGAPLVKSIDLGALALAFVVPAQWIDSPRDLWRHWLVVVSSVLAATVAWDAATAAVIVKRGFLMDWPVVYGTSLVFFGGLLWTHGALVAAIGGRRGRGR
jgi:hypothetical protein